MQLQVYRCKMQLKLRRYVLDWSCNPITAKSPQYQLNVHLQLQLQLWSFVLNSSCNSITGNCPQSQLNLLDQLQLWTVLLKLLLRSFVLDCSCSSITGNCPQSQLNLLQQLQVSLIWSTPVTVNAPVELGKWSPVPATVSVKNNNSNSCTLNCNYKCGNCSKYEVHLLLQIPLWRFKLEVNTSPQTQWHEIMWITDSISLLN